MPKSITQINIQRRLRYENDPQYRSKVRLNQSKSYQKHKAQRLSDMKKYNQYYGTKFKYKQSIIRKLRTIKLKNSVYKMLGGYQCIKCGIVDERVLEIDHIFSTGKLDKRRFGNINNIFLNYYKNHPIEAVNNLQILCANCHLIKTRKLFNIISIPKNDTIL